MRTLAPCAVDSRSPSNNLSSVEAVQRLNVQLFGRRPISSLDSTSLRHSFIRSSWRTAKRSPLSRLAGGWSTRGPGTPSGRRGRSMRVRRTVAESRAFARGRFSAGAASCRPMAGTSGAAPSISASRTGSTAPTASRSSLPASTTSGIRSLTVRRSRFTILTKEATEALANIHSRMPVVLPPDRQEAWLDSGNRDKASVLPLLELPPDDSFVTMPVSSRVNAVKHDDPTLLEPEQQRALDL